MRSILMLLGCGAFLSTLGVPLLASIHVDRMDTERYVRPVMENVYADVCPTYRDASLWMKWTDRRTRRLAWCEDYLERL